MDRKKKVWLLVCVLCFLLTLQYHISTRMNGMQAPAKIQLPQQIDEMLQTVASRMQIDGNIPYGPFELQTIGYQLGRELLMASGCDCDPAACCQHQHLASTIASTNPVPTLYIITPTFRRPEQIPELTRLAQTLMHVPNMVWLVIEDANVTTPEVTRLLKEKKIRFHHLLAPMPSQYMTKRIKPKGVSNRNRAIEWLRANATSGVMYFADDDNTYDIRLFDEIRTTKNVSMFPVGLCTKFGVSSPVLKNGTFVGFYDGWIGGRKFPVDMAGFAINLKFLFSRPKAAMPYKPGFEEDGFLRSLAPLEPKDIEFKAENCTQILVWHTQTKKNQPSTPLDMVKYKDSNIIQLKKILV